MNRQLWRTLSVGAMAVIFSGCFSVRTYTVNRPRVDQGIPGQSENAPVKTRKMVVMEVVEKDKAAAMIAADQPVQGAVQEAVPVTGPENNFTLPQSAAVPAVPVAATEYTVQKDDTLQKIAKKTYGSFSKWTKIYDANRDAIKDPNFLKPGTVLKIPSIDNVTQPADNQ
jgi:nucleoid-associated protein YgaU